MPTKRLCDHDKNRLRDKLETLITRPEEQHLLPMTNEEQYDFVRSLIPDSAFDAYETICMWNKSVVQTSDTAHVKVKGAHPVTSEVGAFSVNLKIGDYLPSVPYVSCNLTDPAHQRVVEWAAHIELMKYKRNRAYNYMAKAIDACSSIGQVKRVLPGIEEYAPSDVARTLADAERRSRVPANFNPDRERYQELMDMLAIGQLCSPLDYFERRKHASVNNWESYDWS